MLPGDVAVERDQEDPHGQQDYRYTSFLAPAISVAVDKDQEDTHGQQDYR